MRNTSTRVDVVTAESTKPTVDFKARLEQSSLGTDEAQRLRASVPDEVAAQVVARAQDAPHTRFIMLAPTKQAGQDEAQAIGVDPVAIITPRTLGAARGIEADAIMESAELTPEQRDELMPHALPSIATTEAGA